VGVFATTGISVGKGSKKFEDMQFDRILGKSNRYYRWNTAKDIFCGTNLILLF